MFQAERHRQIMKMLREQKTVKIGELTAQFGVSVITIRRDLDTLAAEGLIKKVYGGATLIDNREQELTMQQHPYFSARITANYEKKEKLGRAAAKFVSEGETVILGIGTTCLAVARNMKDFADVTVLTNSLAILNELTDGQLEVHTLGGKLHRRELTFTGWQAIQALNNFCADKAFIDVSGISLENGLTDYNSDSVELCSAIIKRADTVCLVADSSKFGRNAFSIIAGLDCVDVLITDSETPKEYIDAFRANGTLVVVAED